MSYIWAAVHLSGQLVLILLVFINKLESVERSFTKRLTGMRSLSYKDRLKALAWERLELRRLRVDLIVYYGWMLSPVGRNAYLCCSRYGVSPYDIAFITKDFVCSYVRRAQSLDVILTVRCLLESWTALCQAPILFSQSFYTWWTFVCYLSLVHWLDVCIVFYFFLFMYLVYDFNNK